MTNSLEDRSSFRKVIYHELCYIRLTGHRGPENENMIVRPRLGNADSGSSWNGERR